MKVLYNILYSLFIALLVVVAGLFLATLLPIPGNIRVKIVESGSMEPVIHTGSIVIIKPEQNYAVGDIVTFGEDSKAHVPTTHRIVEMRAGASAGQQVMTTKGDANNDIDKGLTPMNTIIGKVLLTIPYAGYIIELARKPSGFVLLIGIPAAVIIIDELSKIVQEFIRMRRQETPLPPPTIVTSSGPKVVDLRKKKIP